MNKPGLVSANLSAERPKQSYLAEVDSLVRAMDELISCVNALENTLDMTGVLAPGIPEIEPAKEDVRYSCPLSAALGGLNETARDCVERVASIRRRAIEA